MLTFMATYRPHNLHIHVGFVVEFDLGVERTCFICLDKVFVRKIIPYENVLELVRRVI